RRTRARRDGADAARAVSGDLVARSGDEDAERSRRHMSAPFDARDRKFAAALRLLSKRVAILETRAGITPAPNVMHDNRPAERVETDPKTRNGEDHGHNTP